MAGFLIFMPATTPTIPFIPEIPENPDSKAVTLSVPFIIYSLSRQKFPRLCTFPINTRCRISGNTFPRFPIIPEIPDNSRFKGSFAFIDASLCKRDNKKEALQMKSFFFYFL